MPLNSKVSYFDYNATHPPIASCLEEALEIYKQEYFNPSGITRFSLRNQKKIEEAREYFGNITGKAKEQIVFSSTGTEANYLLIKNLRLLFPDRKEFIVSPFEHSSFYEALREFGFVPIVLSTDKSGLVSLDHLEQVLEQFPKAPVGVILAGNETGVLQPMHEINTIAKRYQSVLVSDLMQAAGKMTIDYGLLDGFTFSSHKLGGGVGASLTCLVEPSAKSGIFQGGNQENGKRAGTENLFSILAFVNAFRYQESILGEKTAKLLKLRDQLEMGLESMGVAIIGKNSPRLSNTSFGIFPISDIDFFLIGLEDMGIIVSTGSSCKSRAREASSGLLAMGYSKEEALRALRISMGVFTTEAEVEFLLGNIQKLLSALG